jgi:hypothetical protein
MKSGGRAMHREATRTVKAAIEKLLDKLPSKFATAYNLALELIREEVKLFFEQNSSDGTRSSTRRVISNAKIRLHNDLSTDITTLSNEWSSKFPVSSSPEIDESDDEMDLDDQIFVEVDNSPDDDYQGDIDGDAS